MDRLQAKLWEPAAKLRNTEILNMIHGKLPRSYKNIVRIYGEKSVKNVNELRKRISDLENDPT